jgi:hypothetical protein
VSGCRLRVRVTPRGGADRIDAIQTDEAGHSLVRVRVRAAPADGEANAAVIKLLARALGLPRSRLDLVAGATSRTKTIWVDGLDEVQVLDRLVA